MSEHEPLDAFINFADKVMALRSPLWAEKCPCGGEVTVDHGMPTATLRRAQAYWWGRHQHCTRTIDLGGDDA